MVKNEILVEKSDSKEVKVLKDKTQVLSGADGLRAIACLSVIIHHFFQKLAINFQSQPVQELQSFFLLGSTGVSVFFVLSGFLLSYPFWKQYLQGGDFPSMRQYALRRAARIVPGYYVSLLVCSLIVLMFHIPSEAFGIRLIAGLTFTAGFHYVTLFPNEINGPFWSISFEVFCYFLMPAFMFALYKISGKKRSFAKAVFYWLGVFAVIIFLNQLIHILLTPNNVNRGWQFGIVGGAKSWMPNYNPVGFFGHFSIGIMTAGITMRLSQKSEFIDRLKRANVFDIIGLFSLATAFALLWFVKRLPEFSFSLQNQPYYFPLYALLIGATLAVTPHSNWFGKILDNSFFRYTAKVSFGLYIWHYLIIFLVANLWVKNYNPYMGMVNIKVWAFVSLVILVVSYIVSALSYKFIEKPVLDRVHGKKKA